MTGSEHWVSVDLGGTWVRVVLSNQEGIFLERINQQVDITSPEAISLQIVRLTRFLCEKHGLDVESVKGVGVASAGPLIREKGVLMHPANLPFDNVPITRPIREKLRIDACLINDCVAAALGENRFGASKGISNCVYITISTGIGGGAIVNDTLLLGKDGNGHEIGHFVIDYEGRLVCGCGKRGHWEAYCSGRSMPAYVRMRIKEMPNDVVRVSKLRTRLGGDLSKLTAAHLFAAANEGDSFSSKMIDEIGTLNAMGFATVINAYDPELITVGGAVTLRNENAVLKPIKRHVREYAVNRIPKMMTTPLGEDVVLYGGLAAAQKYLG